MLVEGKMSWYVNPVLLVVLKLIISFLCKLSTQALRHTTMSLLVLRPEWFRRAGSIPGLQMPWLRVISSHDIDYGA